MFSHWLGIAAWGEGYGGFREKVWQLEAVNLQWFLQYFLLKGVLSGTTPWPLHYQFFNALFKYYLNFEVFPITPPGSNFFLQNSWNLHFTSSYITLNFSLIVYGKVQGRVGDSGLHAYHGNSQISELSDIWTPTAFAEKMSCEYWICNE